ncbi:hypothetical protein [Aquimarina sp. U1-2]|uniref:hypothetical protein n=1 Tax=Aquimarina sp. U1-2 TaxID=2823141 RepID=UPI001AEC8516|nr:hypothetical protein [Aquimarina sp. U1-2]
MQNVYTWTKFLVNQDYIAAFLCINKERPKLQCNGKCFLMQQLKQNEPKQSEDEQFPLTEITKTEFIDFSKISDKSLPNKIPSLKKQFSLYHFGTYEQVNREIFHPPKVYFASRML